MNYLITITAGLTFFYIILILYYVIKWRKIPLSELSTTHSPKVSIIIAARNEEQHILSCVESCLNQNYPSSQFEVIVVDDQSEDDTYSLLENIKDPKFKLMRLGVWKRTTIQGSKKKAIAYGVSHANGDIILTTDADCIVKENWIHSMTDKLLRDNLDMVTGPVQIKSEKGFLNKFQILDFMSSCLMNAVGIQTKIHFLGNGANLAFKKNVFIELMGFEGNENIASGDDVFMMRKIANRSKDKIQFNKSKEAIVTTLAMPTLKSFYSQRLRWAGKMKYLFSFTLGLILNIVFWQRISIFISIIIGLLFHQYIIIYVAVGCLVLRWLIDFILHYHAALFFDNKKILNYSIPLNTFFSFYFVSLAILSWLPLNLEWKDRKI